MSDIMNWDTFNNHTSLYPVRTPFEYFALFIGKKAQEFTTNIDILKDVKVGDEIACINLGGENTFKTLDTVYNLEVKEGINKGNKLKIEDENPNNIKLHMSILNPNLQYKYDVIIRIINVDKKIVKFNIINLNYVMQI